MTSTTLAQSILSFLSIPYNAILACGVILSGIALLLPSTKKFSINAEDLTKKLHGNSTIFVDIRDNPKQRLPKSKMLKIKDLHQSQQLSKHLKNKEANIVLISENRMQGLDNLKLLKTQGYQNVLLLEKGLQGWLDAGLPVVSTDTSATK
jgi:rhodanese-related sulfurtransferase